MFGSFRPSDRVRRNGADPAMPPRATAAPDPLPIIAGDELEGEPPPEDGFPETPRLQQPARGRRLARKPDEPIPPLTAEERLSSSTPGGAGACPPGTSLHVMAGAAAKSAGMVRRWLPSSACSTSTWRRSGLLAGDFAALVEKGAIHRSRARTMDRECLWVRVRR